MQSFMFGMFLVVLAIALLTRNIWWPTFKIAMANRRWFWATVRENSAIGRRRAQNTWMMYLNLTRETYTYILQVCDGYNTFVDGQKPVSEPDKDKYRLSPKARAAPGATEVGVPTGTTVSPAHMMGVQDYNVPFESLQHYLKSEYKFVHGHAAIVWIGWPWFNLDTVKPWYLTPLIKEAASRINEQDKGGQEFHTVPMKVETFSFPLPIKPAERKVLTDRISLIRQGKGELLSVTDLMTLLSLNPAETSDGFEIPVAVDVDLITVGPWEMVTGVEFILSQLYGLLNSAVFHAMASVQALTPETLNQSGEELRNALMQKISDALQLATGMAEPNPGEPGKLRYDQDGRIVKPKFQALVENVQDNRLIAVMARMGEAILRVRLVNIEVPKELADLLNAPAKQRAQKVADLVAAEKRKAVATVDADSRQISGEGEKRYQMELAEGDRARVTAFSNTGKDVDAQSIAARLTDHSYTTWESGVSSAASGKVIVTGAPGASGGTSLEGVAAGLAAVVQSVGGAKASSKPDKKDKEGTPTEEEKPAEDMGQPADSSEEKSPEK